MINLNEYLRLPIRAGADLQEAAEAPNLSASAEPSAPDYFKNLIDGINRHSLTHLRQIATGKAYRLAYVRGSLVEDRLLLAKKRWQDIVELLDLTPMLAELEAEYGAARVLASVAKIRETIISAILYDRRSLGACKLLYRMKRPEFSALTPNEYEAIAQFIEAVSKLSRDGDETVVNVLSQSDLGDAQNSFIKDFHVLLRSFGREEAGAKIEAEFDRFIQILREHCCLHPALPIQERALHQLATAFQISVAPARELVTIFRFAWLCRYKQPKHFSDISLKGLVVAGHDLTSAAAAHRRAEKIVQNIFAALETATQSHAELQRFCAAYPNVRVTNMAWVLILPRPLFEVFLAVDDPTARLRFVTQYHLGGAFFERHLSALFDSPRWGDQLRAMNARDAKPVLADLPALLERSVYLKNGIATDGRIKHEVMRPFEYGPKEIKELLRRVMADQQVESIAACAEILDEITKDNLIKCIRGVWMIKYE